MAINVSAYFSPQYLGLVEVEESRGMHVCEEAVKKLKVVSNPHTQKQRHTHTHTSPAAVLEVLALVYRGG